MTKEDAAFYLELWADWQDDLQDGRAIDAAGILADSTGAKMDPDIAASFNAFAADPDGSGFIQAAFSYELGNHEYIVTGDLRDTLAALGFTAEQVRTDPRLTAGLKLALQRYSAQ